MEAERLRGDRCPSSRKRDKKDKKEKKEKTDDGDLMGFLKSMKTDLQGSITGLQGQVTGVSGQVSGLTTELRSFKEETNTKFGAGQTTLDDHAAQIKELQEKPAVQQVDMSNPYSAKGGSSSFVPKSKRTVVCVRGFPYDSMSRGIEEDLRVSTAAHADIISSISAPGKLSSVGKLYFKNSEAMWTFLKRMKGTKLTSQKFPQSTLSTPLPKRGCWRRRSHSLSKGCERVLYPKAPIQKTRLRRSLMVTGTGASPSPKPQIEQS